MTTISQLRDRLLEVFSEKQADVLAHVVIEAHDDLVTRADFHELTGVVRELAEAQKRTEARVEELTDAQKQTEVTVLDLIRTQQKMLIRLDRNDGRTFELLLTRHLPAYVGREFRRCRVIETAELVDSLEGRLPDAELDDLSRSDVIASARDGERQVHLVVEVSCTADADDIDRASRRAATLSRAGLTAIGIVACEAMDIRLLAHAARAGVRVLLDGRFVSGAA
ncbi:MAG: hypothetical protein LW698_08015 [Planctomycetaceae bacterium]|jgi:hypothetical protein|nr:hypothetical protein [Planctomycetaceae bacterium]